MAKTDEITQIRQLVTQSGWKVVEKYWNLQREAIIHKGKKNRSEEKKIAMWAELDGFDKAKKVIYNLANYRPEQEPEVQSE